MKKNKTKSIVLVLDDEMQHKLEEIKKELGMIQTSDTLRYCISYTLKKLLPEYVRVQKMNTPEARAIHKVATQEAKQKIKEQTQEEKTQAILKALDAKILDNGMCEFKTYQYINKNIAPFIGSRKINISELTNDHVAKQYQGATKEEILEALNNNHE
jgi:hypothetical protein